MIPIGDESAKGVGVAFIGWMLILANVAVFIYQFSLSPEELKSFLMTYGAIPAEIRNFQNLHTLVTSIFLHGGFFHLSINMLFLWVFGDNIEYKYGRLGFLIFYLVGGVAASLLHVWFHPESTMPAIGASGAVAAVLGSYLIFYPTKKIRLFFYLVIFKVPAFLFLLLWIGLQVFSGFLDLNDEGQQAQVAYWAHVGGFVFGFVVAIIKWMMGGK